MKTIILPGYSEHNKEWAEEVAEKLTANGLPTTVHYWRHWDDKSLSLSLREEIEKTLGEIGNDKVNIIAKSVGVFVALNLIPKISSQVNKVILCGIASVAGEDRKGLVKTVLSKIPIENILCIQNENDKFVPFPEAEKFYHSVEPKLKVISKPRSDHHYPYPEDFQKFLTS
ncbi:hypothetical protein A2865_02680 [Candidatus Woesebacteria bacterium RIFCSPHIGHO2_01_FULL_39_17]|uniref:Alpha/beta hydrolase n=2 Tax=Candidatus Woeseibacteriota TaxID=1752722 RepID=A0A0G0LYQ9_9BACT|nr:MAG: hypothetical protein UT19_C0018G0005 [Candidatus Woesebacteria bacterium GW2011_GWB1_39_10b]KKS89130.1 MAG: hypothetical protein UV64_C0011G0008 [Parcubacteria group bacterium GW2011_GWC1_43_11b]OGM22405.1 MAG: hypothetical protein A2865_02680 [Candidatus Woesebacteria bacterium RIFCSPHIGHO2_01_FULL_39_17]OGM61352.1 MAG: hypothetical protein A3A52_05565 [Candidatus Woesebacteria bacterium RIFCSPLOWO2_01_FULL_39_14]